MTDQLSGGVVQPTDAQTACQVPLVELLKAVPRTARLVIEDGPYSTSFIPVGRYCHEAAEALAVPQAPLQAEPVPVAQVVAVYPPGPDGPEVNWLGKTPKVGTLLYAAAPANDAVEQFEFIDVQNHVMRREMKRIAKELRAYNPAGDEYKGAHIHGVWARELEAAYATPPAEPVPVVASEPDECPHGEAHIVHDCLRCGAPVCCDKCCAEDTARRATPQAEPAVAEQAREAFKTWMVANKRWISLAEYPSGKFVHTPTELMAEAWIASRVGLASQSTPPPESAGPAKQFRAYLRSEVDAVIDTSGDIARQEAQIDEADHLLLKFNELFPEAP